MGLSGLLAARQGWAETAKGQLGEGDERLGRVESKRAPCNQPDLGVERLHASVIDTVQQGGLDVGAIVRDGPRRCDKALIRQRRAQYSQCSSESSGSS